MDDDPDFAEFVRMILERRRLSRAGSVRQAGLALIRAELPGLVLLDAMMSYELAGVGTIRTSARRSSSSPTSAHHDLGRAQ